MTRLTLPDAIAIMAGARQEAQSFRGFQIGHGDSWQLWPHPSAVLGAIDRWLFAQAGGSRPVEAVRAEWPAHRAMPEGLRP